MADAVGNPDVISPAVRRRLQQQFERGKQASQTAQFDYATELLTSCVISDPGSQFYTEAFLDNLQRKYSSGKKGGLLSSLRSVSSTAGISLMNANRKKDWLGVLKAGLEVLKLNPSDTDTLLKVANACSQKRFVESQLVYLKSAQQIDPKSFEIQRECALALEKVAQYDEAVACWMKAEALAKPASVEAQEARKAISRLQVDMTVRTTHDRAQQEIITAAGGDVSSFQASSASKFKPFRRDRATELEEKIAANPGELLLYQELAGIHEKAERWTEAENLLLRGLEATGGDLRVREQLEDVQMRHARQQAFIADRRAAESKTAEAQQQAQQVGLELLRQELEVFRKRVDRYPTNTHWKFELGVRLKQSGNFNEAVKMLQEAKNDPKHRGAVLLDLGICFQQIKQFKLAKQHYVEAVQAIPEREVDLRKKALYRAAMLSVGLAETDANQFNEEELGDAEKYFTQLAALDFSYRDVSAWLDKIAKVRDKG
jgi:tetratricopeptide (TPR) repeat protein